MKNKLLVWGVSASLLFSGTAYAAGVNGNYQELSGKNIIQGTQRQELSSIEKIFNEPDAQNIINQIGYDVFDKGAFLSANSKVSKDYRFNIGDRVDIFFWGDSVDLIAITGNEFLKSSNDLSVDKDGNIFIPGVGIIQAKGKTSAVIEQEISKILSVKFNKINAKVTLADASNFPIIVTGNVKYKGTIYLNSHSTIIDALSLAGGVLKTGSLREIVYINGKNKSKLTIDLYDVLLNGNLRNIKFNEGDMIFVRPLGKVAALKEGVKNPGIYEFKENETLRHLIDYAGGFLPSIDPKVVQVESFDSKIGQRILKDVPYKNLWYIKPADGDNIAFRNLYNASENLVYVEGNIKHPGSFQYKAEMKLSDIIKTKDELLSQTFIDQAIIERLSDTGKDKNFIPVSLTDFFNGYTDPELKPQDKIKIYPATTAETVEVAGYIVNPGLIPYQDGLTLKKLLGSVRFGNSTGFEPIEDKNWNIFYEVKTKNIVVEIISKKSDKVAKNDAQTQDCTANTNEGPNNTAQNVKDDQKNVIEQPSLQVPEDKTKIVYLYDLIVKNDSKFDIPIHSGDKIIFRSLQPHEAVETVGIFGYVNMPGIFKYQDGMKLKDAISLANGLDKNGYLKGLVLLRPSIASEQKKNVEDSLVKLEEDISLKVNTLQTINDKLSSSDIQGFLNSQEELLNLVREKAQRDYGRLMIEINTNNLDTLDNFSNIELKPGDEIFIPYKSKHVVVMGEVLNNIAVSYNSKMPAKYYINKVGGYTDQARKNRTYIIKANGSIEKLSMFNKSSIEPSDTIMVPKKIKMPINWLEVTKSLAQIAGNILSSMYILTKI